MSLSGNSAPRKEGGKVRAALAAVVKMAVNDWPLKLLSLTIALVLWTGLIAQDPTLTRERVFRDVTVTVSNRELLKRNGYIITSDLDALLDGVTVTVDVPQMQYQAATADRYNVRVDLSRLEKREGLQELPILTTGSSTYGNVTRVSPASISVQVEEYVTRSYIPVNVVLEGDAPEGFYAADMACDPAWITVSGPRSEVERVERVEASLRLNELPAREGTVVSALDFTLVDGAGNPVRSDMLEVTRDSVLRDNINVSVTLYTRRDVEVLSVKPYAGQPAAGYEVTDVYVSPSVVTLAGARSVVDTVTLLQPRNQLNIAGATDTVTGVVPLTKPMNLAFMSATEVTVTVVIRPVKGEWSLTDLPVTVQGLPQGWQAELSQETGTVRVTGDQGAPERGEVFLFVDVSGLAPGVHTLPLQCVIAGGDSGVHMTETEPQTIQVTLVKPE